MEDGSFGRGVEMGEGRYGPEKTADQRPLKNSLGPALPFSLQQLQNIPICPRAGEGLPQGPSTPRPLSLSLPSPEQALL